MTRLLTIATMAAACLAGPAWAETPREPLQVFKDVARQVQTYSSFTVFDDVRASLDDGEVTLQGRVTMPFKRDDIERRVSRVEGVRAVRNEIEVLPVSIFDNELRVRIARAIYGHPSFWHYASMANPPIHIVVERGHVTLTGAVHNEVERALARSLAASFGAFSVTNALQTDAEIAAQLETIR
jgi:osmotically-inducible protein OsmY